MKSRVGERVESMVLEVQEKRNELDRKAVSAKSEQSQMGKLITDMNQTIGSLEEAVEQAEGKFAPVLSPLSTKDSPSKDEPDQPCSEVVGIFRNFMERVRRCTASIEQMNDRCDL